MWIFDNQKFTGLWWHSLAFYVPFIWLGDPILNEFRSNDCTVIKIKIQKSENLQWLIQNNGETCKKPRPKPENALSIELKWP